MPSYHFDTSLPLTRIDPEGGDSNHTINRPGIVLPQPLSPTSPRVSSDLSEIDTPRTAFSFRRPANGCALGTSNSFSKSIVSRRGAVPVAVVNTDDIARDVRHHIAATLDSRLGIDGIALPSGARIRTEPNLSINLVECRPAAPSLDRLCSNPAHTPSTQLCRDATVARKHPAYVRPLQFDPHTSPTYGRNSPRRCPCCG